MKTTHAVTAETTIDGAVWKALVHFEHLGSVAYGSEADRPVFAAMLTRNGEALPDWFTGEGKVSCTVPWIDGLDGYLVPSCPSKKFIDGKIPSWIAGVRGWQVELRKACSALTKEIRTKTVAEVRDLTIYPMAKGELYSRLAYLDAVPSESMNLDYHGHAVETFHRLFGAVEHALQWRGWRGHFPWRIGRRGGEIYVTVAPMGNNPYPRKLGHEKTAPASLGLFPAIHAAFEAHAAEHLLEATKGAEAPGLHAEAFRLDQAPAPVLATVRAYAIEKVGAAMSVATPVELYAWFERLLPHEQHDFYTLLRVR